MAMVDRANRRFDGLGGHLSTFASAAALYDVGFNHFFHGKSDGALRRPALRPGSRRARRLRAGLPRRAPHRGAPRPLPPRGVRRRAAQLPAPPPPAPTSGSTRPSRWASDPLNAIYQARFNRYLLHHEIVDTQPRQGVVLRRRRRDGRARGDGRPVARRARAARQPHLRRQLQPATPRRTGAGQRQDHPGARGDLPRRGLERHQGGLGPRVGRAARPRRRRRPREQDEQPPSTANSRSTSWRAAPTSGSTSSAPTPA